MAVPFIEPLALETILVNVLSGSQEMFLAIALFFIFGMAAFFRMSFMIMMFMFVVFLVMFNAYIPNLFFTIVVVVGSMLIGRWVSKLVTR